MPADGELEALRETLAALQQENLALRDANARLRQRDRQQRALIDNIPWLVWLKDGDGRFLVVNSPFADAFGWASPEALIGHDDFDIVPRAQAESFRQADQAVLATGVSQSIEERLTLTGTPGWFETFKSPAMVDGELVGVVGASRDISERRRLIDSLRENEQKLGLFIDGVPSGIAMFDREMRYLAVSRRFLDDYGLTGRDVIGHCHYDLFPSMPAHWRDIHRAALAGERQHCDEEWFCHHGGIARWIRWDIRPWRTAAGEVGGVILFVEDISARKQADEELKAAKLRAERANDAKSRFLAAASHDLRQPLSALSLYVGTLKHHATAANRPLIQNMSECLLSLNTLLTDLLDFSKLEAGVVKPSVTSFAVADLLTNLASAHLPAAQLKGLQLRCRPSSLTARTDQVLFKRILYNFTANAIRYTESGGVLVGCRQRNGKTWIEIWDTGIGIPNGKTDEIFEEFRQLDHGERNQGSGLGLAIVSRAAALLGLTVRVRSRPGGGSLFAVELPLGEPIVAALPPALSFRAQHIAIVDDNPLVLEALACALGNVGHRISAAPNGADLFRQMDEQAPDLLISDYRLGGGFTGLEVIRQARVQFGAALPALLITGDTDPALIRSIAKLGITVHHKPLDFALLQEWISQCSELRPAIDNLLEPN